MTTIVAVVSDVRPGKRRKIWPWVVAAVVVVVLAAGIPTAIWFAHWRSSLRLLTPYPMYGASIDVGVGTTAYFGNTLVGERVIDHPHDFDPTSVNVTTIKPVVLDNTADAKIVVLRCVSRTGGPGLLGQDGAAARSACISLTAFHSGPLTLGFNMHNDDIVIAVTPRHAGKVNVAGVTTEYSSGARHTAQHVGPQIKTITK